jgi:hypothetical protein
MPYPTSITGYLAVTPPLAFDEIRASPYFWPGHGLTCTMKHCGHGQPEASYITRGTGENRTAVAIEATHSDRRGEELLADLQAVIDAHPGHQFSGHLLGIGESYGDLWILAVRDRRITELHPRITWPDAEPHDELTDLGDDEPWRRPEYTLREKEQR